MTRRRARERFSQKIVTSSTSVVCSFVQATKGAQGQTSGHRGVRSIVDGDTLHSSDRPPAIVGKRLSGDFNEKVNKLEVKQDDS